MELTKENINLIFGLKLKQLRQSRNLSLSELANRSSLSVSYLNEIESGKKYPKADKILALANSLGVSYDNIVSSKLNKSLAPIRDLLDSNILKQLPIDHYGLDINKLIAILANAPVQLSALVATIIEIAKSSEMSRNIFSRTALRIYKEINENYFEDLEESVDDFTSEYKIKNINLDVLLRVIKEYFDYTVDDNRLNEYKELSQIRAIVNKRKKILYVNNRLTEAQLAFILGKEIAYNYLDISDRSYLYSASNLSTFDQLLNNFRTSYFATALLIQKKEIINDFGKFINLPKWDKKYLLDLLNKYQVTPEMLFQRISNVAPTFFQINKFYFLRFRYNVNKDQFELSKELHLNTKQNPGGYHNNEHYCRRWVSIDVIEKLKKRQKQRANTNQKIIGIQNSKFINSGDEYLSISIAKPNRIINNTYSSVTFGFLVNKELKSKIKFLKDPKIKVKEVNDTCEFCELTNCEQRVAEPTSVLHKIESDKEKDAIDKLISDV